MKITKKQLKRIIKEEKAKLISEAYENEKTMVFIDDGVYQAVVPLQWVKGHADDVDGVMISKNEAMAQNLPIFYEGSHAGASHIEDYYFASNTLHNLWDEGYLENNAPLHSIFH